MTPETAAYITRKDKIMQNVKENLLNQLKARLDSVAYKYLNNTQVFADDIEYANICRKRITAAALKLIAEEMERDSA